MEFKSFWNSIGEVSGTETLSQESQTVPDMSLSVRDILERFRRGTLDPSSLVRNVVDTDDDIDDDVLDDVHDLVDVQRVKSDCYGKVFESIRNDRDNTQSGELGTSANETDSTGGE